MNFLQRRRILRRISLPDLVPVRLVPVWEKNEHSGGATIDLKIPKFRNEKFARWFIPARKSIFFTLHLDQTGSRIWLLMDGNHSIGEIAEIIQPELGSSDALERIGKFCSRLYAGRYITFRQLMNQTKT